MTSSLRLFLVTLLLSVTNGLAIADPEATAFATAVQQKLSFLTGTATAPDAPASDAAVEQVVLVDISSDGSVLRAQDQAPVADRAASAKLHRAIFMAAPFPKLPQSLYREYAAIRLSIIYVVAPTKNPSVTRVEIKGGLKYVEFQGAL